MAGLGERQPSVIQFAPSDNHLGNIGDIGDMMIEDDSMVNQLGFGNPELDRRGGRFDMSGETAGKLLEGFEAVRERPGKEQKRGY